MSVLILKNVENEGPGTIEDFLKREQIPYDIVDLEKLADGVLSKNYVNYNYLIIMGGPMSVHDTEDFPYLLEEEKIVTIFIKENKPVLGICLGSQIIAKALGEKVYVGKEPEIGWYDLNVTDAGKADETFRTLIVSGAGPNAPADASDAVSKVTVFHWHGETFNLPPDAKRLAFNELYPNQAFKYGEKVYALQFHIEVNREMIIDWMDGQEGVDMEALILKTDSIYDAYLKRADAFYKQFFRL